MSKCKTENPKWSEMKFNDKLTVLEKLKKKHNLDLNQRKTNEYHVLIHPGEHPSLNLGPNTIQIKIYWGGTFDGHTMAQSNKFITDFTDFLKDVKKFGDEFKKEYPDVKVDGI